MCAVSQAQAPLYLHRIPDGLAVPLRRKHMDKFVHVSSEVVILADFNAIGVRFEQVIHVDGAAE
mgnify:CR=1 FL=1